MRLAQAAVRRFPLGARPSSSKIRDRGEVEAAIKMASKARPHGGHRGVRGRLPTDRTSSPGSCQLPRSPKTGRVLPPRAGASSWCPRRFEALRAAVTDRKGGAVLGRGPFPRGRTGVWPLSGTSCWRPGPARPWRPGFVARALIFDGDPVRDGAHRGPLVGYEQNPVVPDAAETTGPRALGGGFPSAALVTGEVGMAGRFRSPAINRCCSTPSGRRSSWGRRGASPRGTSSDDPGSFRAASVNWGAAPG